MPSDNDGEYCEIVDDFGCLAYESLCETDDPDEIKWIRVERSPDEFEWTSQAAIIAEMHRVSEELSSYGNAELYERKWVPTGGAQGSSDRFISVLQFNMLAEGLSSGPQSKAPFPMSPDDSMTKSDKRDYGGFTEIVHPEIVLNFEMRRWRLLDVLLQGGAAPYDVICVEEIDRYRGFFAPILRLFGYDGLFVPKPRAPGVRMGWYSDGCALFFRTEMFELLSQESIEYQVGNQVFLTAGLKHLDSEKILLFAVTHLKAQSNEVNEQIRARQIDELVAHLDEKASLLKADAVVLCGDFNADPGGVGNHSAIQRLLRYGKRDFISAYGIDPPSKELYTTWKIRGMNTMKRIIDYIFSSGAAHCIEILDVPQDIEVAKLPGLRYPSDHIAIGARFEI